MEGRDGGEDGDLRTPQMSQFSPPAQMGLPPVNASSSLLAPQPPQLPSTADDGFMTDAPMGPAGSCAAPSVAFDTFDLHLALTRSRQASPGSNGGLRRAVSAPHSMDQLGHEAMPGSENVGGAFSSSYMAPSGGPMRRVSSSLGMRRSSSFFWTPAAHRDFERALAALAARGVEAPGAIEIIGEMGPLWRGSDLKLADVDKHLKKKLLVQRRVLQTLSDRPLVPLDQHRAPLHPPPPPALPAAGAVAGLMGMAAVAEEDDGAAAHSIATQFKAQQMQMGQLAAAREALVSSTEAQIVGQQQQAAM